MNKIKSKAHFGMFLFDGSVERVDVSEDEVEFVVVAALVGPKHDGVRGPVLEVRQIRRLSVHNA